MAGRSSRGNPAMADIVRTVVVMGAVLVGLWLVGQLVTQKPDQPTSAQDYQGDARQVAAAVDYPVRAPRTLPDGWYANAARLDDGEQWHLGVVTDDDGYVGLEQARVSADRLVKKVADGGRADGSVTIAGSDWMRRSGPKGDRVLVREVDGVATVVLGKGVSAAELADYVRSLAVVPRR